MASSVRMEDEFAVAQAPLPWRQQNWAESLESSIERGANHLLSLQTEEGFWLGELEADTTLESDYIYYLFVLGKADPDRIAKLATYIRRRELEDGGWSIYPGGPSELNATCKAYFALKLADDNPKSARMVQARETVMCVGRPGTLQFLRSILSGGGGRARLGDGAVDPAGDDAPAELVLPQHLRDVFVDARDRDSDGDSVRVAAGLALAGTRSRR